MFRIEPILYWNIAPVEEAVLDVSITVTTVRRFEEYLLLERVTNTIFDVPTVWAFVELFGRRVYPLYIASLPHTPGFLTVHAPINSLSGSACRACENEHLSYSIYDMNRSLLYRK